MYDLVELGYRASPSMEEENRNRILVRALLVDKMDPKNEFQLVGRQ